MPRREDDEFDDDRPRRRRPRDEADDEDRPSRSRSRRDEDDDVPRQKKKKSNLGLILGIIGGVFLLCCGGGGFAIYYFGSKVSGDVRDRKDSADNLKQIGLAFHAHNDRTGALPNNSYDANGRPLLSWRVHLLPDLGEKALYDQFRKDEAWDGPNNRRLVNQMPRFYATDETRARAGEGKTYLRGFSHQGANLRTPGSARRREPGPIHIHYGRDDQYHLRDRGRRPRRMDQARRSRLVARPTDAGARGWPKGRSGLCAMCDGSVRSFKRTMDEPTWRGLITYSGNEIVNPD